jgi:predicted enzyme related to lactoylglutathione lyase
MLGLSMVKKDGDWVEFEAGGVRIALNGREPAGSGAGGGPVLTFEPEMGLEAAVQRLSERGVEFTAEISEHPWGRVTTFQDTEGNDLQLYEPPKS